ncbi:hypothetical protein DPMN_055981 [Dreissena polymorpha]|uniref:Uncharacterized protein n=1 Tax=Dreissena polymorpha TaxID=45954 RepID=A0A9D4HR37_DREPO|nr:hypothetical protein DPMN_055981 [Dreissena polymorpha]
MAFQHALYRFVAGSQLRAPAQQEIIRKRKKPAERLPYKSAKQQSIEKNEAAQTMLMLPKAGTSSTPDSLETQLPQESTSNNPTLPSFTSI